MLNMNLDIFKAPDPSGTFSKEKFVSTHYIEEYEFIMKYCLDRNMNDIPFKEKLYLVLNNLENIPKCKNINCDNRVNYRNSTLGYYTYCSNRCVGTDPDMLKHKEDLSIIKFGTKAPSQSNEVKEKALITNNRKYGGNSPMSNKEIQDKSKNTCIDKWGVDNINKVPEIIEKRVKSFKENIDQYKESYKKTSLERYGTEHPWMNKDIHDKTIKFFYEAYNSRILDKLNNYDKYEFKEFKYNPTTIVIYCKECMSNFEIQPYQFYGRSKNSKNICINCYPIENSSSLGQLEIESFIRTIYSGNIITNDKSILKPYEIDIYLPELNIGIEYNGLYWHSEKYRKSNYHQTKNKTSEDKGVRLISIWEDDWNIKEDIVKSFISNKLNKTKNKIYARKCEIKSVSYKDSMNFLNNNHLQGDIKSPIRLGLYYDNILVSLMTFSKLRIALSQKNNNENVYELTRFCNALNTNVTGGASKLLNYFIQIYKPEEIHSYSDNMISDGSLYRKLGFEYKHTSKPGYSYVVNDIRSHRFNWRKYKLVDMGYDKSKTESEIMSELGHYRVYNAGNKKWVLKT